MKQVFEFEKSRFAQVFVVKNSQTDFFSSTFLCLVTNQNIQS